MQVQVSITNCTLQEEESVSPIGKGVDFTGRAQGWCSRRLLAEELRKTDVFIDPE